MLEIHGKTCAPHQEEGSRFMGLILSKFGAFGLMIGAAFPWPANAVSAADIAPFDQPFIVEISGAPGELSYRGQCEVTDALGTTRRTPLQGTSGDRLRFVGVGVVCHLHSLGAVPFAATIRHGQGLVAATTQGGNLTITAH